MTDPYRTTLDLCPACGFGLRDFDARRVCDSCGGIMMTKDDFAHSAPEIQRVEIQAGDPAAAKCPGCAKDLARAHIVADGKPVEQDVGWCEQHGIWFPGGALSVVLAEVGRRSGHATGGAFFVPKWANTGAFRGGSYLIRGKSKPAVHAPHVTAHAGKALACPDCKSDLVRSGMTWMCSRHGALIEEHALHEMIGDMSGAPWEAPAWTGKPGARPCPACGSAMAVEMLESVEIDRCAQDGLWMEPGELESVLAKAGDRGRKGWVARLFRRKS